MSGRRWTEAGPFADLARFLSDPEVTHWQGVAWEAGDPRPFEPVVAALVVTSAGLMPVDEAQLAAWRRSYVMVRDEEAEREVGVTPIWRRR